METKPKKARGATGFKGFKGMVVSDVITNTKDEVVFVPSGGTTYLKVKAVIDKKTGLPKLMCKKHTVVKYKRPETKTPINKFA